MTITPFEGHGFFYDGEFYDVGQYGPGETPEDPPFRQVQPWQHPFHHESFWNTPVGSGATYVSTGNVMHTSTFGGGTVFQINYNNWSDPFYLATDDDPMMEVEQRANLPTNWQSVGNSSTGPTTGQGALQARYTGIRIPAAATWQSSTNTDRKVIVVQPAVTLNRYNASNTLISTESFPAGTLAIEMHKFYRVTGGTKILTTNLSRCDLRGYGMGYGALASGVSMSQGYIRRWEWDAAAEGDITAIRHALKIGLPNAKLKAGQVWPASHQDGNAATAYAGHVPMGSMMVLNKDFSIEGAAWSGTQAAERVAKAIAWTLQNFGAYVLIRAGSGPIGLGVESTPPHLSGSTVSGVKSNLDSLVMSQMRLVSNSSDVGTLDAARHPIDPSRIAGGGERYESIRPLPIDPEGPWV